MDFCRIVGSNGVESFDSTGVVSAYPNSWAAVVSPDGRYGVGAVGLHSVFLLHWTPSHRDTAITQSHRDGYAPRLLYHFLRCWLPLLPLLFNSIAPTNMVEAFDAVRAHVGMQFPGYINHETGLWSEQLQQWVFLPRRMSKEAYNYVC